MGPGVSEEGLRLRLHRMDAELDAAYARVNEDLAAVDRAAAARYEEVASTDTEEAEEERGRLCEARYCLVRARVCLGWALVGVDLCNPRMRDCYLQIALTEARFARCWWTGAKAPRGFVGRARAMLSLAARYKRELRRGGVDDNLTSPYDPAAGSWLMTGMLEERGVGGLGNVSLLRRV